jgi:hypothetical protein
MIDPITDLVSEDNLQADQQTRMGFYAKVLTAVPTNSERDLQYLCNAWAVVVWSARLFVI